MQPDKKLESYEGPGKVWSAVGGWGVGGLLGGVAMIPFRWQSVTKLMKGEFIKSTSMWFGTSIAIFASSVLGAVIGWNKGARGEQQFHDAQFKLASAENEISSLKQVVTEETTRARFTEKVASRQSEGSQAAAIEADKKQAETSASRA